MSCSILLELLLLVCIIVFIVDLSGVIEELEVRLAKWLKVNKVRIPKPFSCSLCLSWWSGLVFLICVQSFTLIGIAYVALLAYLTPVIYNAMTLIRDLLNKGIDIIGKVFKV